MRKAMVVDGATINNSDTEDVTYVDTTNQKNLDEAKPSPLAKTDEPKVEVKESKKGDGKLPL